MAYFKLDILTPNGAIVRDFDCDEIVVPTTQGEIDILPDHTHLLTHLGTGVLTVKNKETSKSRYFSITHGICKVLGNKVSILSMTSESKEKIDPERAKEALRKAEEKLAGSEVLSDVDLIKYERKLERAQARIRASYLGE